MVGPIALVGSGEFTDSMVEIDRDLLAATGKRRPRVAVVPTASWPDGEPVFRGWADRGIDHFERLGAEVEGVLIRDRADADSAEHAQALGEADLIYLSGGKPDHLCGSFAGSPAWEAILGARARGAIVAGSSAGAMALVGQVFGMRSGRMQFPVGWHPALGAVPGAAVIPHYDKFPEAVTVALVLAAPAGLVVLGIDEDTALIGTQDSWQVRGRGRVTVWRGRERERLRDGATVRL